MLSIRKKAYLALLTTSLIWGIAPPLIKYTLGFVSPYTFLFYRFLIVSLVVFIPLVIKLKRVKPKFQDWMKYLFLGFLATPLTLIILFLGMDKTSAVDASVIGVLGPIVVILGGVIFLKEKVTRQERTGIGLILMGTLITIIQPVFQSGLGLTEHLKGNLLVFLSALSWATFSLLSRKEKKLDPFILTAFSFIVGLFTLIPFVTFNFKLLSLNLNAIPGILYITLPGSVIAYFTYIYGFSKIEASEATIFSYLQPVFAVPVSVIFLKEDLSPPFILGAVLIVTGILVCETRKRFSFSRS